MGTIIQVSAYEYDGWVAGYYVAMDLDLVTHDRTTRNNTVIASVDLAVEMGSSLYKSAHTIDILAEEASVQSDHVYLMSGYVSFVGARDPNLTFLGCQVLVEVAD